MKKIIPFLLLFSSAVYSQSYSDSVYYIEEEFKTFNYEEVIRRSSELLSEEKVPSELKAKVYMMKGISHFVLLEDTLAKYSFLEILRINPQFYPDSIATSPVILKFFTEVKENYAWYYIPEKAELKEGDSIEQIIPGDIFIRYKEKLRVSVIRSLLFPGLGHLYLNNNNGWYLTVPAGVSFLSSVFYLIDTQNKREEYLNTQDPLRINSKYQEYNSSYKIRNVSIIIFSAIWLFSQFDILFTDYIDPHTSHIAILPFDQSTFFSLKLNL
jgi:hypothetical protein